MSDELKDLLSGMMQLNPLARSTIEEVLAHPWMQGTTPSYANIKEEFAMRKHICSKTKSNANNNHN